MIYFEKFGDLSIDIFVQMSSTNLWKKKGSVVKIETLIENSFKKEQINDFKCEKCDWFGIVK